MATPLAPALSLLDGFKPVFVFLLVFGFSYAVIQKTKLFAGDKHVVGIASFVIALLFILIPGLSDLVSIATPWFIVFFMSIFLIVMIFLFAGVEQKTIVTSFFADSAYVWVIILIAFAIFGFALSQVYGPLIQSVTAEQASQQGITYDLAQVIFSPKLLGMLLLIVIAQTAIRQLAH